MAKSQLPAGAHRVKVKDGTAHGTAQHVLLSTDEYGVCVQETTKNPGMVAVEVHDGRLRVLVFNSIEDSLSTLDYRLPKLAADDSTAEAEIGSADKSDVFPYSGPAFTEEQVLFTVTVYITATVDTLCDIIPSLRLNPDRTFESSDRDAWAKAITELNNAGGPNFEQAIDQLGWALSIFYAQLSGDSLGVCDALSIAGLRVQLREWAQRRLAGEIGMVRHNKHSKLFTDELPNITALAKEWTETVWCWLTDDKSGS